MLKAGIIGGSGFIGSHITRKFLEENYKVKVSVTDLSKKEKYEHLNKLKNSENLEISALKLEDVDALNEFAKDCEILIHTGTPFQLNFTDAKSELLDPTIKGTENFLNVISGLPELKKVVFIASVAAYNAAYPLPADGRSADHIYTEEDTPFVHESNHPYAQAKHYADQTVRKFVKENPDIEFEIVSVFPSFVTGKALSDRKDSTSVGLQNLFMGNIIPPDPFVEMLYSENIEFAMVDVKNVAEGVFKAATLNDIHGKNYLLSGDSWRVSDIVKMLNKEQPEGNARSVVSGALAIKELGVKFISSQESLGEFA